MKGFAARTVPILFVILGILAPQGSGLIAALGLADGRVMVICTGDGLRTIRIGEDGTPAEVSQTADHCALVHAAGTATAAAPPMAAETLLYASATVPTRPSRHVGLAHRPSLPRAPPRA